MKYNFIVCDDQESQRLLMKDYLKKFIKKQGLDIEVRMADSAEILLKYLEKRPEVQLFIMDVEMPGMDGMSCAEMIRNTYKETPIVFVTGYRDFAYDAFRVHAMDYILKPITYDQLEKMLLKAIEKIDENAEMVSKKFVFDAKGMSYTIPYGDIFYFEKYLRKFKIVYKGGVEEFYMSYKELGEVLDFTAFTQCHQSYVVNNSKVVAYKNQEISLMGVKETIPVSKAFVKPVKEMIHQHLTR